MRLYIFLFTLFICSCGQRYSGNISPPLENGKVDLSGWNFEKDGPAYLKGDWKLYWKKYIPIKTIINKGLPPGGYILPSPGLWTSDSKLPGKGFATIVGKVTGIKNAKDLHFLMRPFGTSHKLYITNGKKIKKFAAGVNATNAKENIPQYKTFDEKLQLKGPDFYIIIHAANYHYREGGFWGPIKLYQKTNFLTDYRNELTRDLFALGVILIISLYHFAIFYQRKNDLKSLFFGLLCLMVAIRSMGTESYSILISQNPSMLLFNINRRMEFLSLFLMPLVYIEYLYRIFEIDNKTLIKIKKISQYIICIFSLPAIFTSPSFFSNNFLLYLSQIILMVQTIYSFVLLIVEIKKGSRYSIMFLISLIVIGFGIIHDIMVANNIIYPPYLHQYAIMFFIFIQSYIVSSNFGDAFKKIEKLTNKLNEEVDKKTNQIKEQNKNFLSLLSNLDQSFFVFDEEGAIEESSKKMNDKLFSISSKDKKLQDILQLKEDQKIIFNKWLGHAWKGLIPFNDLISLAPQKYFKKTGETISLNYRPIYTGGESKKLEKIICIATDITKEKELEEKAQREKEKVQMVFSFIERPLELIDLIDDSHDTFEETLGNLEILKPDQVFRNFHTLKARLASFKMRELVNKIHDLEEILINVKDKRGWTSNDLKKTRSSILDSYDEFKVFIKSNRKLIEVANNSIDTGDDSENILVMKDLLKNFVETYANKFVFKEVHHYFQKFIEPTKELARVQDKQIEIRIKETSIVIAGQKYKKLFSSLLHVFRNAIDHGIESREERISMDKQERALISVNFEKSGQGSFKIIIKDDGRGINPKLIKYLASKRAKLKHLPFEEMSNHEIIQIIFYAGLSSKEEASDISGRGVGLDAVKSEVERIGGTILVKSEIDKGTTIIATVPILMPFLKD